MKPTDSIASMVNGFQCSLLRQTFLKLQEDENATNEQLVADCEKWDKYLSLYCLAYKDIHRDIPLQ